MEYFVLWLSDTICNHWNIQATIYISSTACVSLFLNTRFIMEFVLSGEIYSAEVRPRIQPKPWLNWTELNSSICFDE